MTQKKNDKLQIARAHFLSFKIDKSQENNNQKIVRSSPRAEPLDETENKELQSNGRGAAVK